MLPIFYWLHLPSTTSHQHITIGHCDSFHSIKADNISFKLTIYTRDFSFVPAAVLSASDSGHVSLNEAFLAVISHQRVHLIVWFKAVDMCVLHDRRLRAGYWHQTERLKTLHIHFHSTFNRRTSHLCPSCRWRACGSYTARRSTGRLHARSSPRSPHQPRRSCRADPISSSRIAEEKTETSRRLIVHHNKCPDEGANITCRDQSQHTSGMSTWDFPW